MGKRVYPLQRIRGWFCYDIEEICALYKNRHLHPKTVQGWLKKGLSTIDSSKPALVHGEALKHFLGELNASGKCKTAFAEMFCFKCKEAMPVFQRRIAVEQVQQSIRAKGRCRTCKTTMHKTYKMDDMPKLRSAFQVGDVLELYDCETSPLNTPLSHSSHPLLKESSQKDLFA